MFNCIKLIFVANLSQYYMPYIVAHDERSDPQDAQSATGGVYRIERLCIYMYEYGLVCKKSELSLDIQTYTH